MRTVLLGIVVILSFNELLYAQHGEYVRKAITNVESVWVQPGAERNISLDYAHFEDMVSQYIEMARFDYTNLPENLLKEFRDRANRLQTSDVNEIAQLLQETVGQEMLEILNDPEIMMNRGLALRDESAWQTFASTKANSIGLTVEELEVLMNSSYLYLPFITRIEHNVQRGAGTAASISALASMIASAGDDDDDDDQHLYDNVTIRGGIIWFAVNVTPDNEVEIVNLLSIEASGSASARQDQTHNYNMTRLVSGREYALLTATQVWVRNLAVRTQEIAEFQLLASIMETLPGRRYSLGIGKREGVYVDDLFELVEVRLDEQGREQYNRVGMTRITRVGDNREDPTARTQAMQITGRRQGVGVMAREYPRVGYDFRFKVSTVSGMNISAASPYLAPWIPDDITDAIRFELAYSYHLAPITNSSLTFLTVGLGLGLGLIDGDPNEQGVPVLGSVYLGYDKRYPIRGRHSFGFSMAGTLDLFNINSADAQDDGLFQVFFGGRANLGYDILLSPNTTFSIEAGYQLSFVNLGGNYTCESFNCFVPGDFDIALEYDELNLNGTYITAGINYSLRQFRFNLFGFLDRLRSY